MTVRRRRRVTFGLILASPLLVPAALWVAGTVAANREVRQVVDGVKERGEPFEPQDFHGAPDAADLPNAVPLLVEADKAAALSAADQKLGIAVLNGTTGPATAGQVRAVVQKNRAALDVVRQARRAGHVDWSALYPRYVGTFEDGRTFYNWQPTSTLLYFAAWLAHEEGDDASAVEFARDLLFVSRAVADYPLMNSQVWAGYLSGHVVKRVEETGPELRKSATPAQVRGLIAELLDDSHLRRVYYNQMCWERAFWLEHADQLGRANPLYRPVLRRDAVRIMRLYDEIVQAAAQPNWPAARAKMGPYPKGPVAPTLPYGHDTPERFVRPISRNFTAGYSGPAQPRQQQVEYMFFSIALQRMAAVALGIRLYQADHDGKLPPTLDALVPQYLGAVPVDPYVTDGRQIGYAPASKPPLLYCIGTDGVDDTAGAIFIPWRPFFGRYLDSDVHLFLGPAPGVPAMVAPTTAPATAPATAPSTQVGQ